MGPYATPNILSRGGGGRHNYTMPKHTAASRRCSSTSAVPRWSSAHAEKFVQTRSSTAVASLNPAEKSRSSQPERRRPTSCRTAPGQQTGAGSYQERVSPRAGGPYPTTTTDWAPIAAQVRDAAPEIVITAGRRRPGQPAPGDGPDKYKAPLMFSCPAPGPRSGWTHQRGPEGSASSNPPADAPAPEGKRGCQRLQERGDRGEHPYNVQTQRPPRNAGRS